jgi:NADPH-dependent glutamate synthase beta subunit-like oxidoreductase/ferredoxin/Pyruvate/2-oxoacid:ferredoxin oxidoreductase delta subunit
LQTITLTIDGHRIETDEGKSVLQAALDAGIYIPRICSHGDLNPIGACRLCVVEVEGWAETALSCTTAAETGMVVTTRSARLKQMRRLAAELMLTAHPSDCTSCPKYLKCELQSLLQYLEVTDQRMRKRVNMIPPNTSNPLIMHDMSRCILCGRCVRACGELRGANALTFIKVNGKLRVGTKGGKSLAEAGCKYCGACIEVCPTGSIRDQEGLLEAGVNRKAALVPCREACPAAINIPEFVRFIYAGNYPAAVAVIREKVPFPLTLGHICNHPCEGECRRAQINEAISVKQLKRFAAEHDDKQWKKKSIQLAPTGKSVAVIGAGPAGLTAAYYLAKLGHSVTVLESLPYAGGMMRVGIPQYRLPWAVIDDEIEEIKSSGVTIKTNSPVPSIAALSGLGYAAVLVATGTHKGVKLPMKGDGLAGILINTVFLRQVSLGEPVYVGEKVVVLGGGNVAFDCAGVARRLGAKEVHVACLEAREEMRASPEEIVEALEEGIVIHPSIAFHEIMGEKGKVTGLRCSKVCTYHFDDKGRPNIVCELGSEHVIAADTVIYAVGQRPGIDEHFGLVLGKGNTIHVDEATLQTSVPGVFAAGDAVTGTASVIKAIAAGRKAATAIDQYLGGAGMIDEQLVTVPEPNSWIGRTEGFARLPRCASSFTAAETRTGGFAQIDLGYDQEQADKEAGRCLQCDLRLKLKEQKFWSEYTHR